MDNDKKFVQREHDDGCLYKVFLKDLTREELKDYPRRNGRWPPQCPEKPEDLYPIGVGLGFTREGEMRVNWYSGKYPSEISSHQKRKQKRRQNEKRIDL